MDVLYIVGKGSRWNNNELRYSLRSIEKHGHNIGRVFLVGEPFSFLSDEVTQIYCYDKFGPCYAHKNIEYKIQYAISTGLLPEHFLIASDDHFYIKDVDFDNYPVYYKNKTIPYSIPSGIKPNPYWYSIFETRKFLLKKGLPIYQTNAHLYKHFDVRLYKDNINIFNDAYNLWYGGEVNLIMGNLMIANGIEPQSIEDCKVQRFFSKDELYNKIAGRHVFSIADSAVKCGIGNILGEMFPEKSRYEK